MVFASPTFLFLFLPLTLILYLVIPFRLRIPLLAIASILFYALGEGVYTAVILISIIFNYSFGIVIERQSRPQKFIVAIGIALNLSMLIYYKYFDFILGSVWRLHENKTLLQHRQ